MILCAWVTVLSVLLVMAIEKDLVHRIGKPLPRWRRLLIPLPVILMLASNLDAVLSFGAWSEAHPGGGVLRYYEYNAWDRDRFFTAGIWSAVIIPPFLCEQSRHILRLTLLHWACHVVWIFFAFLPLMLGTGYPFKQD